MTCRRLPRLRIAQTFIGTLGAVLAMSGLPNIPRLSPPYGIMQPATAPSATAMTCLVGSGQSTDTYNVNASAGGNDPSCSMAFRFQ